MKIIQVTNSPTGRQVISKANGKVQVDYFNSEISESEAVERVQSKYATAKKPVTVQDIHEDSPDTEPETEKPKRIKR